MQSISQMRMASMHLLPACCVRAGRYACLVLEWTSADARPIALMMRWHEQLMRWVCGQSCEGTRWNGGSSQASALVQT